MLPVKNAGILLAFLVFQLSIQVAMVEAQAPKSYIQVDQFGYLPEAPKVAVLHDPIEGFNAADEYIPGTTIEVRESESEVVVLTGAPIPWNSGSIHSQSGDRGWWFDFSALQSPGTYYLYDPSTGETSHEFDISEEVYHTVLKTAVKMFYYNRCNIAKEAPYAEGPWTDGPSFDGNFQDFQSRYIYDVGNAALEKDLSGGWFDAGDFNKYVTFADAAVHNLLWAYRENPEAFGDDWNIPESGNGIPDILDEIKWELDWLLKMNNPDGSTHIKMGSRNYAENHLYPPSSNNDPRYYGPTCTSASISVAGVFAHAATVFKEFPSWAPYVQQLLLRAQSTWDYVAPRLANNQLETACDDGSIVAGDADWDENKQREQAVASAIYLWELTELPQYNQYIVSHAPATEPLSSNFWGPYKLPLYDALLLYTETPNRNNTLAQNIINALDSDASNNWNGYYGFNEIDLFRAHMPDWSYHWGSNSPKASYGVLNQLLIEYGILPERQGTFAQKALEQLHYFHGVNPLGMVHLSNMYSYGAEHCVNQIYHQWFADGSSWDHALESPYGPAPGFLTGGPNKDFTVSSLNPPTGQAPQKAYLDFNDIPTQSWEITEPGIYYQAAYVRLLANFAKGNSDTLPPAELCEAQQADNLPLLRVDWSQAGHQGPIPIEVNKTQIDVVKSFGAKADGLSNDGPAIQQALNAALPGTIVFLPPGEYRVQNTLNIPEGVVLRGTCSENCLLRFDLQGSNQACIEMLTYAYNDFVPVLGGMGKGSTRIRVADPSNFTVGSFAEIQQDNDPDLMYTQSTWNTDWAQNSVGQMHQVIGIEGNELLVHPALFNSYTLELNPVIRPTGLIEEAGVENLGIVREDAGAGPTIHVKNAANCWIRNIASDSTVTNHVLIEQSLHIEVRDSYFHRSHDYGGGGRGYGVNCSKHSTLSLVENNIFQTLRHAMMVKQGASGNVFAYNYSLDPVWDNSATNIPPDISLHGHYPSYNLFEGNIIQELTSSDYWGPSGPGNTFLRNRVEQSNLSIRDASHEQQILGNELTGGNTQIAIDASVRNSLIHGNNVNGSIGWNTQFGDSILPQSLYLCEKPDFFGELDWPSIGPEFPLDCRSIPAKLRFEAKQMTLCSPFIPRISASDPCGDSPQAMVRVHAKIFLEGLYNIATGKMNQDLILNGLLPQQQPFAVAPFDYSGTEQLETISDSLVDWVLMEVRNPENPSEVIMTKAGVIDINGYILDPEDLQKLSFSELPPGNYLLAIYHRSHLAVLSSESLTFESDPPLFDFSISTDRVSGNAQLKSLTTGVFGMFCGDYDSNGRLNNLDFNLWKQEGAILNQYSSPDGDGNGNINNLDFNLWKRNVSKVGNPLIQK